MTGLWKIEGFGRIQRWSLSRYHPFNCLVLQRRRKFLRIFCISALSVPKKPYILNQLT